ncbi:hypothetical protein AOQ84DRAFT_328638 [Glonium stellatum]|uniref:Ribosomal protein bL31m N-terminal domain-containing protein n=1 Tax=Glonium stellatum TaxID=574774 RepID=A0A8E2EN25_9PEZI|nr:hypothetical protein AOQ84DRAFT_328638 [Glonium stellatum]
MRSPIPTATALRVLRRVSLHPQSPTSHAQIRHASLLRRPKRPYTFTQLVTLSDGSTFLHRTTSPTPVYRSTKDQRNTPLWNPSSQKLLNVEEDEAGRLKAFRAKFGRGWDAESVEEATESDGGLPREQHEDSLMDLISSYGKGVENAEAKEIKVEAVKSGKANSRQK